MATSSASRVQEARELVAIVDDGLAVQRRLIEGGTRIAIVCENPLVIAREDPGEFIAQFDAVFAGEPPRGDEPFRTANRAALRRAPRRVREEAMKALVHTGPFRPRSHR